MSERTIFVEIAEEALEPLQTALRTIRERAELQAWIDADGLDLDLIDLTGSENEEF